jgi:hypothetical protein
MSSFLTNALNVIKGDLEVTALPVLIGALGVLEKSPNALGVAAAEAYLLGNLPPALLSAETALMTQVIADLNAKLQALMAAQSAPKTA